MAGLGGTHMKWRQERDALIAQTMAFVQSVARGDQFGKIGAKDTELQADAEAARREAAAVLNDIPTPQGKPHNGPTSNAAVSAPEIPPANIPNDFRAELKERIATFRKHQERFNREREEYFRATLSRLRAAAEDPIRHGAPNKER